MSNFEFKYKDFDKLQQIFDPSILTKANNTANNKLSQKTRTFISRKTRETYTAKAASFKGALEIKKQNDGRLLIYAGKRLKLTSFKVKRKVVKTRLGKRKGVMVQIRKDKPSKLLRRGFMPKDKIYWRKGKSRFPITTPTGPAIPRMVGSRFMQNQVQQFVDDNADKELTAAMNFWIKKKSGQI